MALHRLLILSVPVKLGFKLTCSWSYTLFESHELPFLTATVQVRTLQRELGSESHSCFMSEPGFRPRQPGLESVLCCLRSGGLVSVGGDPQGV